VRWHPIRNLPPPLVKLDRLRSLDSTHENIPLLLTWRAKRFDFPALVGVCDDFAGCGAGTGGFDGGVAAFDEGGGGEERVAAGGVDVEAVAAHCEANCGLSTDNVIGFDVMRFVRWLVECCILLLLCLGQIVS
jgi:hypothetical protein